MIEIFFALWLFFVVVSLVIALFVLGCLVTYYALRDGDYLDAFLGVNVAILGLFLIWIPFAAHAELQPTKVGPVVVEWKGADDAQ